MGFPYSLVAGGVGVLAVIGVIVNLDLQKNHYEKLYKDDEIVITGLHNQITSMTTAQNTQTGITEKTVTKIIHPPAEVQTVIKTIHDAPEPTNCGTPELPQNIKDML